jgi:hypothetical protein
MKGDFVNGSFAALRFTFSPTRIPRKQDFELKKFRCELHKSFTDGFGIKELPKYRVPEIASFRREDGWIKTFRTRNHSDPGRREQHF